jgi:hypothetical protein
MHSWSYIPDKCRYKKPPRELQPNFADSCSVALCVCGLWPCLQGRAVALSLVPRFVSSRTRGTSHHPSSGGAGWHVPTLRWGILLLIVLLFISSSLSSIVLFPPTPGPAPQAAPAAAAPVGSPPRQ